VIPFAEKLYRISGKSDERAIAGLSMGGGQALSIGLHQEAEGFLYRVRQDRQSVCGIRGPARGTGESADPPHVDTLGGRARLAQLAWLSFGLYTTFVSAVKIDTHSSSVL
jgi:hypothetical protein